MVPSFSCIHFVDFSRFAAAPVTSSPETKVFDVSIGDIVSKEAFLSVLAKAMCFPDYFGMNWDALDECMRDLERKGATAFVLVVHEAEKGWTRIPRLLGTFVEVWLSAADQWAAESVGFHLIFVW